jgi:DNA-binding beta-propeller fold protein YncE
MLVLAGVLFRVEAGTFPVGAGPVSIDFNLTDKNDGWFDDGLKLFGGKSLAVAELPRVGLGTLGVSGQDVMNANIGKITGGLLKGIPDMPVLGQLPGVTPIVKSGLNTDALAAAVDKVSGQLGGLGLTNLIPEVDKLQQLLKSNALDQLTQQLTKLNTSLPIGLNEFPVGVDLMNTLSDLANQLNELALPVTVKFHIGGENTQADHMISSLIWPTGAKGFPFDQQGAFVGDTEIQLTKPGLYAFQCKIHPYMLGAVVVDDPLTPGIDFGKTLTVNTRNQETVPSNSDLIFKLVHTFFKITVPSNWDRYSNSQPTTWNLHYPIAPILTYDAQGNPQLIPNLDSFFRSYFNEPVAQKPLTPPATPGVGKVWVDTEFEQTAHKSKPGISTQIDASNWSVSRKVALPQIDMNNPHNMWVNKEGTLIYQTEWWNNRLDVWDANTGALVRTQTVGADPSHVMTEVDTDNVDVVINGGNTIEVFTPGATKKIKTINISPPGTKPAHPHAPWMSSDGMIMTTPNVNLDTTSIINMKTGTHTDVPTGHWPIAQGMLPDNSKFYTANFLDGTETCISLGAPACHDGPNLVATKLIDLQPGYNPISGSHDAVGLGGLPIQNPVSPDGKTLLIANTFTNNVGVVDTTTDTLVKFLPCDAGCHGINFGFKKGGGFYGYVSSKFANTLEVIDVSNGPEAAAVVGKITTDAQSGTAMDDTVTAYSGMGGMGITTNPLAYPGWSAAQQAAGAPNMNEVTCAQIHPMGPAC